jgi:hypothetical protein
MHYADDDTQISTHLTLFLQRYKGSLCVWQYCNIQILATYPSASLCFLKEIKVLYLLIYHVGFFFTLDIYSA